MIPIDHYTFNARVIPALIIALPIAGMVYTWVPDYFSDFWGDFGKLLSKGAVTGGLATAIAFAVSQATRDAGKRLESELWPKWGGPPSVRFLRHRDTSFDIVTKARYHKRLVELGAVASMPAADDEERDPVMAEEFYKSASDWLRSKTRDAKRFPLIFKENVNYGFCRNLLACKSGGLVLCAASTSSAAIAGYLGRMPVVEASITAFVALYLLMTINEGALRRVSEDYARRLLEAIDGLEINKTDSTRKVASNTSTKKSASKFA